MGCVSEARSLVFLSSAPLYGHVSVFEHLAVGEHLGVLSNVGQ